MPGLRRRTDGRAGLRRQRRRHPLRLRSAQSQTSSPAPAWLIAPSSRLVFRGGYGSATSARAQTAGLVGFSRQTPLVSSLDNGLTPAVTLSDPFPASIYPGRIAAAHRQQHRARHEPRPERHLPVPGPAAAVFAAVFGGFQYELPGDWLVDASYAGNITRRLPCRLAAQLRSARRAQLRCPWTSGRRTSTSRCRIRWPACCRTPA